MGFSMLRGEQIDGGGFGVTGMSGIASPIRDELKIIMGDNEGDCRLGEE